MLRLYSYICFSGLLQNNSCLTWQSETLWKIIKTWYAVHLRKP